MRIRDLLAPESICLNEPQQTKKDVLNQMVDLMAKSGKVSTRKIIWQLYLQEKRKEQQE